MAKLPKLTRVTDELVKYQLDSTAIERHLDNKLQGVVSVMDFGAKGDGITDDCYAFQKAANYCHSKGGGRVFVPPTPNGYRLTFPVFLFSNTEFFGSGRATKVVFEDPVFRKGRGGFVMGSSREANRDLALEAYANGTYPGATTNSTTYVNPALMQYLRDNPQFIETSNSSIHDMHLVATYTGTTLNGGYGINMVNAAFCDAYNISGEGWTQVIGMGSDSVPETPSTYGCRIWNISADVPNQDKTFYSVAFVSNSTDFVIRDVKQLKPIKDGTLNGSCIATNVVEDGIIDGVYIPNLGRTQSSEGVLVNNAKGVKVSNLNIGNAKSAVSFFYTIASFNDNSKPNSLNGLVANNCDYAVSLRSKYVHVSDVHSQSIALGEVFFGNSNASNNIIDFTPQSMAFSSSLSALSFLQNNTVKGWRLRTTYLRPIDILVNDKVDLTNFAPNYVGTKVDVNLKLQYKIPDFMKAIVDCRMFLTFNIGSLTKGSVMTMSLRRQVAFDGNISADPYIELTNSRPSTQDTLQDTNLVIQATSTPSGYILSSDTTHGLANSLDLYIEANNNVNSNFVKNIRVQYLGD